jgi:hypothetical protein
LNFDISKSIKDNYFNNSYFLNGILFQQGDIYTLSDKDIKKVTTVLDEHIQKKCKVINGHEGNYEMIYRKEEDTNSVVADSSSLVDDVVDLVDSDNESEYNYDIDCSHVIEFNYTGRRTSFVANAYLNGIH